MAFITGLYKAQSVAKSKRAQTCQQNPENVRLKPKS